MNIWEKMSKKKLVGGSPNNKIGQICWYKAKKKNGSWSSFPNWFGIKEKGKAGSYVKLPIKAERDSIWRSWHDSSRSEQQDPVLEQRNIPCPAAFTAEFNKTGGQQLQQSFETC